MTSIAQFKPFFALIILLISLAAGWYPFKKRKKLSEHLDFPVGDTLATGIFLGAAFLHMLPESNSLFQALGYHYPLAFIIAGTVFLIFLWFEHLSREIYCHHESQHPAFALLVWIFLSVHSIMVGAALGLSQHNSMVIMLFLAIITHKWAESFAMSIQLNKSSINNQYRYLLFFSFCLMTPLGMFIGNLTGNRVHDSSLFSPILMAASAGTFLYLGTLHGLEKCVMLEKCCNLRHFSYVIIGFVLMALVAAYV